MLTEEEITLKIIGSDTDETIDLGADDARVQFVQYFSPIAALFGNGEVGFIGEIPLIG